jgi:hypothetical protein
MGIDNHQPGRPAAPPRVEAPNVPPVAGRAPAEEPTPPRDAPPPRDDPWDTLVHAVDLQGRMERQPHQTLLVAFAFGFVASGALFTRFSARALGLAFRVAALPLLEAALTPTGPDRASRG